MAPTATLTDITVPIQIVDTVPISPERLRIVDPSRRATLPTEIERLDTPTAVLAWVRAPEIAANERFRAQVYFDADVGEPAASTPWAGYRRVLHLDAPGPSFAYVDSAGMVGGSGGDGDSARVPLTVEGAFARAQRFDGVDDYIALRPAASTTTGTVSLWLRNGSCDTSVAYWEADGVGGNYDGFTQSGAAILELTVGRTTFDGRCGTFAGLQTPDAIRFAHWPVGDPGADWVHLVISWDEASAATYVNGVAIRDTPAAASAAGASTQAALGRPGFATRHWSGEIDEVRLLPIRVDPERVAFEHAIARAHREFVTVAP